MAEKGEKHVKHSFYGAFNKHFFHSKLRTPIQPPGRELPPLSVG